MPVSQDKEFAEDTAKARLNPLGEGILPRWWSEAPWQLQLSPLSYRAVEALDLGDYAVLRLVWPGAGPQGRLPRSRSESS